MMPPEDRARRRYQGAQGQQYHADKRAIPEAAFPWVARLRAAKIAPWVRPGDTVLEYGVGLGWNLAAIQCARKLGFDVGEFLEPAVRQLGIEFVSEISQLPEGSIDLVVCHHTLEHAWHPPELLASIHRLLRSGGRLLLFVPYEKERRYRQFRPGEPNHHLYSWNVQTLGKLVEEAGFKVEKAGVAPFGQERFAAVLAHQFRLGELGFRVVQWTANRLKRELEVRVVAVPCRSGLTGPFPAAGGGAHRS
jgi:SAM-dependent methyltransferase